MKRTLAGLAPGVALILFYTLTAAGPEAQTPLTSEKAERAIQGVLRSPAARISRFHPGRLEPHQLALPVDRRAMALSRQDQERYRQLSRNKVLRVDFVTSQCATNVDVLDDILDKQRVGALFAMNEELFEDKEIQWRRVVQTGCQFEYQTQDWFHGFVLTMHSVSPNSGDSMIAARLKYHERHEHSEGDVLDRVKAWNAPGAPPPPTKFNPGHVRPLPFDAGKHLRKTARGFILQFPQGGPLPAPVICDNRLYLSGGFKSRSYHAFQPATGRHIWSAGLSDNGPSAGVCKTGAIIFNTESCTIFALDGATGKHRWSHFLGDPLISTPVIAGDRVLTAYPAVPGHTGSAGSHSSSPDPSKPTHVLAALSLADGKILWQKWIDSEVIFAPRVYGDAVYAASMSGVLYRLNLGDGALAAARRIRATSQPLLDDGRIVLTKRVDPKGAGDLSEALVALNTDFEQGDFASPGRTAPHLDRKVQNKTDLAREAGGLDASNGFYGGAPPAAHAEAAYIQLGRKNVSSLQAYRGAGPLLVGETIVVVQGDEVIAREADDGDLRWTLKLEGDLTKSGGALASVPVAAGDEIFVATLRGEVLRMAVADGKIVKRYPVGAPLREPPLIAGGRIFAATADGRLVMIDTGEATLNATP